MTNPGPAGVLQLQELILRIINLSVALAFITMTVILLWGAIQYLTSGGEAAQIKKASATITWAILGILFLALAWLILLLIQAFTGVNITKFCLGLPPYCLP